MGERALFHSARKTYYDELLKSGVLCMMDDQSQVRIREEAQAAAHILHALREGAAELPSSVSVAVEVAWLRTFRRAPPSLSRKIR